MFKMLRNDKRGFTLVELLVVIAVIGILAAIAIPRFGGFRDRARESAHMSELQALRQALNYAEIEGETFTEGKIDAKTGDNGDTNLEILERYLKGEFKDDKYNPGGGERKYNLDFITVAGKMTIKATVEDNNKNYTYVIEATSIKPE